MDRRTLVLSLRLAALFIILALVDAGEDKFSISRTTDGDVTIVTVTGPRALLDRAAAFTSGQAARGKSCDDLMAFQVPGFFVDWGDDDRSGTYLSPLPPLAEGCPDPLKHVYAVPGTYQITASLYHLGPSDAPISEWLDKTSVTVEGQAPPLSLSVTGPSRDQIVYFQERVPVRWTLSTPTPVDLLVEIIGANGVVLGSRSVQGLKYVSEGSLTVYHLDERAYWQHLLRETAAAVARIHVQENGRDLLVRESPPFRITAQIDLRGHESGGAQVDVIAERTVQVEHWESANCNSYRIDWGDGSPHETHFAASEPAAGTCKAAAAEFLTPHTYREAGTYTIILRADYYGLPERSLDNAPYQVLRVTVP